MKTKRSLFVLLVVLTAGCFLASCGGGSSGGVSDPPTPPSTFTFNITDGCDDGETVDLRFFDVTDNLQWPANTSQAYALNYNNTYTYNLSCNTGDKICYGASDQTWYWGVSVDDSQSCPDCCWTCANATESINLVCTSTAGDRAKERQGTQHARRIPSPTSYFLPPTAVGPRLARTNEAFHTSTVPIRGVSRCGKGKDLGVTGRQYALAIRPAFALWGTLPVGMRPTWLVGW